jgi:transcription-repair coupling factor (superfamily II helicase)
LGAEQHGHLDAIGYELYIKLLNEAVLEEKGVQIPKVEDCTLSLRCDAYISEKYVPYATQRIGLYKRIAMIETEEDENDIIDELIDRFGDPPKPTLDLLKVSLLRSAAMKCSVSSIVEEATEIRVYLSKFEYDVWSELLDGPLLKNRSMLIAAETPNILIRKKSGENSLKLLSAVFNEFINIRELLSDDTDGN